MYPTLQFVVAIWQLEPTAINLEKPAEYDRRSKKKKKRSVDLAGNNCLYRTKNCRQRYISAISGKYLLMKLQLIIEYHINQLTDSICSMSKANSIASLLSDSKLPLVCSASSCHLPF